MANIKKSIGARVLSTIARPFGLDVVNRKALTRSQNFNSLFKLFGLSVIWGRWDEKDYITEGFLKNAGLYSIVTRICKTAAIAPFRVYKVKNEKKLHRFKQWTGRNATKESIQRAMLIKADVYEEINNHPLQVLIDKPNDWQGGNQFTQESIGFKLLTGNRLWFKNVLDMGANQGRVTGVYNLPPQHIQLLVGETLWSIKGYQLTISTPVEIPKELILHSRYWNPDYSFPGSHLWGLSPLRAASRNIDRSNSAEDRAVAMLQNAGAAGILFNKSASEDEFSQEKKEALKRKVNEELLGVDNTGRIGIGNGDLAYINFAMTAVDMQLLKQEQFTIEQLCNVFGVPPGLFMASANATDNNIAAWNRQLITQAVVPALSDIRDDWNEIAKSYGDDIYVDYDISVYPELQEDLEKVANIMDKAWWIKPNEKRLAMSMDEDPDEEMMNRYLVPTGMTDINDLNPANLDNEMTLVDEEDDKL